MSFELCSFAKRNAINNTGRYTGLYVIKQRNAIFGNFPGSYHGVASLITNAGVKMCNDVYNYTGSNYFYLVHYTNNTFSRQFPRIYTHIYETARK